MQKILLSIILALFMALALVGVKRVASGVAVARGVRGGSGERQGIDVRRQHVVRVGDHAPVGAVRLVHDVGRLMSHLQNCRSKVDARRVADWCRSGRDSAYLMLLAAATFGRV